MCASCLWWWQLCNRFVRARANSTSFTIYANLIYDNIPGYKPNDVHVRVYYLVCILHVCSGAYVCVCFSAGYEVVITGRNVALCMIRECHSHVHTFILYWASVRYFNYFVQFPDEFCAQSHICIYGNNSR